MDRLHCLIQLDADIMLPVPFLHIDQRQWLGPTRPPSARLPTWLSSRTLELFWLSPSIDICALSSCSVASTSAACNSQAAAGAR